MLEVNCPKLCCCFEYGKILIWLVDTRVHVIWIRLYMHCDYIVFSYYVPRFKLWLYGHPVDMCVQLYWCQSARAFSCLELTWSRGSKDGGLTSHCVLQFQRFLWYVVWSVGQLLTTILTMFVGMDFSKIFLRACVMFFKRTERSQRCARAFLEHVIKTELYKHR